jgi:hypothetical protein
MHYSDVTHGGTTRRGSILKRLKPTQTTKRKMHKAGRVTLSCFLAYLTAIYPLTAQTNIIRNGSNTATLDTGGPVVIPGFHFEPEVPLQSLKNVPTWYELEQMLDNPYNASLCASLPTTVDALVRNTPGTTQITGSPTAPIYPA